MTLNGRFRIEVENKVNCQTTERAKYESESQCKKAQCEKRAT